MNDFNLHHIGLPQVQELGRGVTACIGGSCPSRVFGCHMFGDKLRYGFIYKNGSNSRIAHWENNEVALGTIPRGQCIIIFNQVTTANSIKDVTDADLRQPWFDREAQRLVQQELRALEQLADTRNELIDMMKGLSLGNLENIKSYITTSMNK
jgi:hypothetical protein